MIKTGPALPCPRCQRALEASSWNDEHSGRCFRCSAEFEFFPFRALVAVRASHAAQAVVVAEESVCFFHAENRAEAVCEECGRLLCPVCAINFGGRKICPTCISSTKSSPSTQMVRERSLPDNIALSLALLPLLIWPLTLVTAPVALWYGIRGWKLPGSVVRGPGRLRLVLSSLIAGVQIAVWCFIVVKWIA